MSRLAPFATLIFAMLCWNHCAVAGDEATYQYRGRDYVATGTSIARRLNWTASLPFDKSFGELTSAQRALVREQYVDLKPGADPPYPEAAPQAIFKLIDASAPAIVPQGDHGEIMAVAQVDANGDATSVAVYKTTSAAMSAAVADAITRTKFTAGHQGGEPVAMEYVLRATLR
jgi:Gram-negative bacterial TonB protein C-terminal